MQTIRIEILNQKALKLLKGLETLNLIKVVPERKPSTGVSSQLRGKLSKKTAKALEKHVSEIRNEWGENT